MVLEYREERGEIYLLTAQREPLSDDVVRRVQRGDSSAWRELIVAHQRDVLSLLALLLDTTQVTELDGLAVATLSSILRDLAGLAPLTAPRLSTWIHMTAARLAVAQMNSSNASFVLAAGEVANPSSIHVTAILRSFAGFTDDEIARALGLSVKEVPQGGPHGAAVAPQIAIPVDLADRVIAARRAELTREQLANEAAPVDPEGKHARQKLVVRTATIVTAACVIALVLALARTPTLATNLQGAAAPVARQTLSIGPRAIAVAEAGAVLHWRTEASATGVTQDAGDVFYRVERLGQFTIHTPVGDVRADGACLRVALDATETTVVVSQGRATISTSGNGMGRVATAIASGQRAVLRASGSPIISDALDGALR